MTPMLSQHAPVSPSLSKEQRAENSRKLKEAVKKAKEYITVCL